MRSDRSAAGDRGHLLIEAMVSMAVVGVLVTTLVGAANHAELSMGNANADQQAWLFARQYWEAQRAAPITCAEWTTASRTGAIAMPGEAAWTWTVTVADRNDPSVTMPGALNYKVATIRIDYRSRSVVLEAIRW